MYRKLGMTKHEFEQLHGVRLRNKRDLWWARVVSWVWSDFSWDWWTTVRFPFRRGVIGYPMGVMDPMDEQYAQVRAHELVHVEQQRGIGLLWSVLLYFFVPLPICFSGRWFIERPAYLADILAEGKTVDAAVQTLWRFYVCPWPRFLMRRWFEKQIARRK